MPTSRQLRKQRIDDLYQTIQKNPGVNMIILRAKFAVAHGVSLKIVSQYLALLTQAGLIHFDAGKIWPVKQEVETKEEK